VWSSVETASIPDIGHIRITEFTEQTTNGVNKAISELKRQIGAAKIKDFIIDLRNNPGGLLDQAVSVSGLFLNRGEIVSTRGRSAEERSASTRGRGAT
jgi:carboxyl-terminal processing protease